MSRRANSANPAGAHARLTGRGVEAIAAAYARLGQPALVRLPSLLGPEPDRLLEACGYSLEGGTATLAAPIPSGGAGQAVELAPQPTPDWRATLDRINGRDEVQARVFADVLAAIDAPAAFAAVRREGRIVSAAYGVVAEGWLCLEAVATDPGWRGGGLAGEIVGALMAWGGRSGAQAAALQVTEDNGPALRLYRRLGFERELYRYHYRRAG